MKTASFYDLHCWATLDSLSRKKLIKFTYQSKCLHRTTLEKLNILEYSKFYERK